MRLLNSTKVSRAVRSTARRELSEGGFSSTISSLLGQVCTDKEVAHCAGDVRFGM